MMNNENSLKNCLAFTENQKEAAADWFRTLRDSVCATFEAIEATADEAIYGETLKGEPDAFELTPWRRDHHQALNEETAIAAPEKGGNTDDKDEDDKGGGEMSMMRGRVFEKVGVHISTVFGLFSEEFRGAIPGTQNDPRFWASGISVIAHPRNPHLPAAHMNTRMITTQHGWFGGGGDLNPMMDLYRTSHHSDTIYFHHAFRDMCARHDPDYYGRFKENCDTYFYLPHRDEHRGVGGVFYDRLNSGNWAADFAFTQDVGRTFLKAYAELIERRLNVPWSEEDRAAQAFQRGRYAEFNLLYDRGTTFGLKTGGNVEAILSSLPPLAAWQ